MSTTFRWKIWPQQQNHVQGKIRASNDNNDNDNNDDDVDDDDNYKKKNLINELRCNMLAKSECWTFAQRIFTQMELIKWAPRNI